MNPLLRVLLRVVGVGALVAGGLAVALAALVAILLLGPLVFWLAWNVLDLGHAVGLPELGFWGVVLATLFLVVGWFPKVVITAIVFLVDPSWFHGAARVHWPEPTVRSFAAVTLLALLASRPHTHAQKQRRRDKDCGCDRRASAVGGHARGSPDERVRWRSLFLPEQAVELADVVWPEPAPPCARRFKVSGAGARPAASTRT